MTLRKDIKINYEELAYKNKAIAPGLTLVYWVRESCALLAEIQRIREELWNVSKGYVWWYGDDHLHSTIMAPKRGAYKRNAPFSRSDLPNQFFDIVGLIGKIESIGKTKPIEGVTFKELKLKEDGSLEMDGSVDKKEDQQRLRQLKELSQKLDPTGSKLDPPKRIDPKSLHITVGYIERIDDKFKISKVQQKINEININVPAIQIKQVSLVHYLRRTLEPKYIVGQVHLTLGDENTVTEQQFYHLLGL